MEQEIDLKTIGKDLAFLKRAVVEMQEAMRSSDVFLDEEDKAAISGYVRDKEAGKLSSHDNVEKELGL